MTQVQEKINDYQYKNVEPKWQEKWTKSKIYDADISESEKYFINFPFPYINGAPHLGHGYSLLKAEAMARFQRMLGKNVLFPFAFHATGEPIAGAAKRVKAGDESQLNALRLSGVPEKEIPKFEDSEYIINYFKSKWLTTAKGLGLAIDWRRQFVTTQLTPTFSKFIEWQYRKLKNDGYVVQGSHPVIWCPADQNPTGDHDRLEGEGARVVDFIVLKFYSKTHDAYFLPATLRPETIFGVTNMFVHPTAEYVKLKVNGEQVIVSRDTVIKFEDQKFEVEELESINPKDLIGTYTENPVTGQEVIVLPGDFIDVGGSTGVVMSVPAHAPMDWITLVELQHDKSWTKKWGIMEVEISSIEPISLIEVNGYGEYPAGEEINTLGITSRDDSQVKQATRTIYRKEQNSGILKDITGKYAGDTVDTVKDKIIQDFRDSDIAFILKEPGEPVVCRCGTRNHVKFLENQWFLKFSDPEWKQKTHNLIDDMDVFPEEARKAFHNTIDWLENKACARRSGLGTPMPWDTTWIIETLSDSVIYMAYYIVSKYVNAGDFTINYATDEVYDYIMMGNGNPNKIATSVNMPVDLLKQIREELEYFYGFDLRTSGKDLLNNHLSYMLMHHTAIFPDEHLPKGVAVNGYVTIDQQKMSKRHGNFKTIEDVISSFGVDATRLGFLVAGESMKDASFALAEAESYVKWIQNIYELAFEDINDDSEYQIDRWLRSRIQKHIEETRNHLSYMSTRSAFQSAYHEILQDIKWYGRRRGSKGQAYRYAVETMVLLVCPFVPHVIEEIWEKWGRVEFASEAPYPEVNPEFVDKNAEYAEKYLASFIDDIRGLRRFLKDRDNPDPTEIEVFVAPEWMYGIYTEAFDNGLDDLIKRVMQKPDMRKMGKEPVKYSQALLKDGAPPDCPWGFEIEWETLQEAHSYIEKQAEAPVSITLATDSSHPKAKAAVPRRPGINFIM